MNIKLLPTVNLVFYCFSAVFNISCANPSQNPSIILDGELNSSLRDSFRSSNTKNQTIEVSSFGGFPDAALPIAKSIADNENKIYVRGICLSACAEYILPAAQKLKFIDSPLIGFHWNATMTESLMKRYALRDIEKCAFKDSRELQRFHSSTKVNEDFWKQTLEKLGKIEFKVYYKSGECPWHEKKFEHELWFPTSEQLRNEFGLKFQGALCADSRVCFEKKIDRRWPKGKSFIVGNQNYTSKGISYENLNKCKRLQKMIQTAEKTGLDSRSNEIPKENIESAKILKSKICKDVAP